MGRVAERRTAARGSHGPAGGGLGCVGMYGGGHGMVVYGGTWCGVGGNDPRSWCWAVQLQSFSREKGKLTVFCLKIVTTMPKCCNVNGFIFIYLFFEWDEHSFPFNCLS